MGEAAAEQAGGGSSFQIVKAPPSTGSQSLANLPHKGEEKTDWPFSGCDPLILV